MIFLNPIWLLALPLIALPILIHLLNHRRHRTIQWGAMQFLLSAKRMSRGMARLRQILIMAARMAAIAGLIFAISRPLSSGWVGSLTGGQPETVIVLLDRSASMQQQRTETGETKLASGLAKISAALQTVGREKPIVLIESCLRQPITIDRPKDLLDLPHTAPTESTADWPELLQTALEYISDNETGRTDIWICSDAAGNDWNPASSRWQALNSGFSKLDGVRFHVLNFPASPAENLSIVVDRLERIEQTTDSKKVELVIDLTVQRDSANNMTQSIPLTFNINGLRSVVNLELTGEVATLIGHRIPIDQELTVGWGSVELSADASPADNAYYFAFADPPVRQTVLVCENTSNTRAIELAAATSAQLGVEFQSKTIGPAQVSELDWQQTALLVWQAPLPDETVARQIKRFVDSGRSVIFLPPAASDSRSFAGLRWGEWKNLPGQGEPIGFWNNQEDLLSRTRNGQPLPVNDLLVYRYCELLNQTEEDRPEAAQTPTTTGPLEPKSQPNITSLAKLENGATLLGRIKENAGSIYFLSTLPIATHSSLDREGVTLFAMTHRAIANGADSIGLAKQFVAGSSPARTVADLPTLVSGAAPDTLAQIRSQRAGVYGSEKQLIALNRPPAEDVSSPLSKTELSELFAGLDFHLIEDQVGSGQSLASEVWRFFVALMGIALVAEAVLCLPPKPPTKTETISTLPNRVAA